MSDRSAIKLLGISGSLRAQSYNSAALSVVGSVLPQGMEFNAASLAELPFYNADVEQRGFPVAVEGFRKKVADADALIFAVPEYNFSVPGVLKNALEWLSRPPSAVAAGGWASASAATGTGSIRPELAAANHRRRCSSCIRGIRSP